MGDARKQEILLPLTVIVSEDDVLEVKEDGSNTAEVIKFTGGSWVEYEHDPESGKSGCRGVCFTDATFGDYFAGWDSGKFSGRFIVKHDGLFTLLDENPFDVGEAFCRGEGRDPSEYADSTRGDEIEALGQRICDLKLGECCGDGEGDGCSVLAKEWLEELDDVRRVS